jgi:hypothetical protein
MGPEWGQRREKWPFRKGFSPGQPVSGSDYPGSSPGLPAKHFFGLACGRHETVALSALAGPVPEPVLPIDSFNLP